MTAAVAKGILRLWKMVKTGSSASKITRMKKLKEMVITMLMIHAFL